MGLAPCWRESWREVAPVVLCRLLGVDGAGEQLARMWAGGQGGEGEEGDVGHCHRLLHAAGSELVRGLPPVPLPRAHARAGPGEGHEGHEVQGLRVLLLVAVVELGRPDRAVGCGGGELDG